MDNLSHCQLKGHENNSTSSICTYKDCDQDPKQICSECIAQQIHNHGMPNQDHLMQKQQFLEFIKNQCQPIYDQKKEAINHIQMCIKGLQHFIQSTKFLIKNLEDDLATTEKNNNIEEIEQLIKRIENNQLLENNQIQKIINLNNYHKKYEYNLSQDLLKQLITHYQDLQKLLDNNINTQNFLIKQEIIQENQIIQDNNLIQDNQIIQSNELLVYDKYLEQQLDSIIYTSQISYDEKYLVVGGKDCKIQVFDIITKQMIKSIQLDNGATICLFTKDSRNLIYGDAKGYVFCYDVNNNFSERYNNKVHSGWVTDLICIDNDQMITCSRDKSIIVTNISQQSKVLLIQNAHNDSIQTIDYDQYNDFIISGSIDNSIKFYNRTNGEMQFEQQNAHNSGVYQVQLISDKNNNLLSSNYKNLILWQIDYNKKELNNIKVFNQLHFNFTFVNNNNIILICNQDIKILDKNLTQALSINHNVEFRIYSLYQKTRQLSSLNYIIVAESGSFIKKNMQVLKKQ